MFKNENQVAMFYYLFLERENHFKVHIYLQSTCLYITEPKSRVGVGKYIHIQYVLTIYLRKSTGAEQLT